MSISLDLEVFQKRKFILSVIKFFFNFLNKQKKIVLHGWIPLNDYIWSSFYQNKENRVPIIICCYTNKTREHKSFKLICHSYLPMQQCYQTRNYDAMPREWIRRTKRKTSSVNTLSRIYTVKKKSFQLIFKTSKKTTKKRWGVVKNFYDQGFWFWETQFLGIYSWNSDNKKNSQ